MSGLRERPVAVPVQVVPAADPVRARRLAPIGFGRGQSDIGDLALVGVAIIGAVLALLTGAWIVAVLLALPSLIADVVRGERPARLRRLARRVLLDRPARSLVRAAAVIVAVAGTVGRLSRLDMVAVFVALITVHLCLTVYAALAARRIGRESTAITWRNLPVDLHATVASEGPQPLPDAVLSVLPLDGVRLLAAAECVLFVGVVMTAWRVPVVPLVLAVITFATALLVVALGWRAWGSSTVPLRDSDTQAVEAVGALQPEVVFYFSSPASGTYALAVWADVINAMRRPVLVVVRERSHLAGLDAIRAPLVVVPTVATMERVVPPTVRVVLYPTNVVRNNEMVRIPGPLHCFIGHGDSDKVGSFSPLNRMYDEIWVAGEAAIDRYRAVDEGIDLAGVRAVGRPQLAEIERANPTAEHLGRLTVLYAPTWEGFFDEADYSSVAAMGERIVEGALTAGARVLFKPHPLTGHRLPEAARARAAIEARIGRAGHGSMLVPNTPNALYAAFNDADVLITDISSVITDFLASRKPYIVTNRRDLPPDQFLTAFPSAGAAVLLGSRLAELPDALADAQGVDTRRLERGVLATRLLGDAEDPLQAFLTEIDAFVERSATRAGVRSGP